MSNQMVKTILQERSQLLILAICLAPSMGTAQITEIIDAAGPLTLAEGIAVDGSNNVFVAGRDSDNALRISPLGVISEIIDATGDGLGNPLTLPAGIALDATGNAFVTGRSSDNGFEIPVALTPVELEHFSIE